MSLWYLHAALTPSSFIFCDCTWDPAIIWYAVCLKNCPGRMVWRWWGRGSALILFARKYVTSRIFFPFSSVAKVNKIHYEFLIITAAKDKACQRERAKKKRREKRKNKLKSPLKKVNIFSVFFFCFRFLHTNLKKCQTKFDNDESAWGATLEIFKK